MEGRRWLGFATIALGVGLALNAWLGPLVAGAVAWHYGESLTNQGLGLDAFSLGVVAPLSVIAGILLLRRHVVGAFLALPLASYAMYMLVQYVVGPEYLREPGNSERAFALYLAIFVLAGVIAVAAWREVRTATIPRRPRRAERRLGLVLGAIAAFVVAGMYLANGFVDAIADFDGFARSPGHADALEHPTAYWVVAFLDLGIVVPMTLAVAAGLVAGRAWAGRAAFAVIGWFALVPPSVAAMAIVMSIRDDPAASLAKTIVVSAAAVAFGVLAARAFRPLFREPSRAGDRVDRAAREATPPARARAGVAG